MKMIEKITLSELEKYVGKEVWMLDNRDIFGEVIHGELCHQDDYINHLDQTEHTGTGPVVVMRRTDCGASCSWCVPYHFKNNEKITVWHKGKEKAAIHPHHYVIDLKQ